MYILDPKSKIPLHIQLYEEIKKQIISELKVGDKLPSIRQIASEYKISKTTVSSAYAQLYAEGYCQSRQKSGYYVSELYIEEFSTPPKHSSTHIATPQKYTYDFFPAQLDKDTFPIKTWKRLYSKTIDESMDLGSYHAGEGELGLREEIAKYLIKSRGVRCEASQIIICSGFSDAMGLLAKLIRHRYQHFGIENPGYHVARRVFEEYGYKISKIPLTPYGISLEALKTNATKLIYITPSHQYPTGITMPISYRLKLLEYIHQVDGIIIEDDYDSELVYTNRPIPALQGLDRYGSVVYMGTFAKALSPAMRVSYMVLPQKILNLFNQSYDAHFPRVNIMTQKTLATFMQDGYWERHLRKVRTLNKKKHNLMLQLFEKHLSNTYHIISQGGGLAILIMPSVPFDWQKFHTLLQKHNIKIYLAKERSGGDFEAIRMGFGGFTQDELKDAVAMFGKVWRECLI